MLQSEFVHAAAQFMRKWPIVAFGCRGVAVFREAGQHVLNGIRITHARCASGLICNPPCVVFIGEHLDTLIAREVAPLQNVRVGAAGGTANLDNPTGFRITFRCSLQQAGSFSAPKHAGEYTAGNGNILGSSGSLPSLG